MENFQITNPQSLGLQFSECQCIGISASAILKKIKTRMYSSRMRTVHSSGHLSEGGLLGGGCLVLGDV